MILWKERRKRRSLDENRVFVVKGINKRSLGVAWVGGVRVGCLPACLVRVFCRAEFH